MRNRSLASFNFSVLEKTKKMGEEAKELKRKERGRKSNPGIKRFLSEGGIFNLWPALRTYVHFPRNPT